MKYFMNFYLLFICLVPFSCLRDRDVKDYAVLLDCNKIYIAVSYSNSCINLKWECNGNISDNFRIIRKSPIKNKITAAEFTTQETEYTDCSILEGLSYQYQIIYKDKYSESKIIKTEPESDFDHIVSSAHMVGEKLEIELNYTPLSENPFDYDQLNIKAEFIKPDGNLEVVTGFYYTDYEFGIDENGREKLTKGESKIKIRYFPDTSGDFIVKFFIKDGDDELSSGYYAFTIGEGTPVEYVSVSSENPYYFKTGKDWFFPVGFNIGWAKSNGLFEFQHYMDRMREVEANLFRMWMIKWSNALEWTAGNGNGDYKGLMRYAQDNAARIDKILEYAENNRIKILLTFGSYLEFTTGGQWNEGAWIENPYNATNGGPCKTPEDFFVNEEARRIYKNRLKYISARWGYSPSIFAYEFFNETNAPFEWVKEMSAFLKKTDQSRHMISTTYGDDRIFSLKNIDFTMAHLYGNPPDLIKDYPVAIAQLIEQYTSKYNKPFLLAEFGIDWTKSDSEYDPDATGTNLHNGVFTALSNGSAGSAMLWWWNDYIDRYDLYKIFKPLSKIINLFGGFESVKRISSNNITHSEKLNIYTIGSDKKLLIWIQNKEYSWYNIFNRIEIEPVPLSELAITNLNISCTGELKYVDTLTGDIIDNQNITIDGALNLKTPEIKTDILYIFKCAE